MQVKSEKEDTMDKDYLSWLKERRCPACHQNIFPQDEGLIGVDIKGIVTGKFGWHATKTYSLQCGDEVTLQRSDPDQGEIYFWLEASK